MSEFNGFSFLTKQQNDRISSIVDYYSDATTKRRIMSISAESHEDVISLFQGALKDELNEAEIDNVISNEIKRDQLFELLDCILFDLSETKSNSMHLLIIKLSRFDELSSVSFIQAIADNPNLSIQNITFLFELVMADMKRGFHNDFIARPLAYNQNTPSEILHDLFEIDDLTTRKLIAKHRNTSTETLDLFLSHKSVQVRRMIAECPNATVEMQMAVINEGDSIAISKLGRNSNLSDEAISSLLCRGDLLPPKKRIKQFLEVHPVFFNLSVVKDDLGLKPKKGQSVPEISESELLERHEF